MRKLSLLVALAAALAVLPGAGASAAGQAEAANKSVTVTPAATHTWNGTMKTGTNPYYFKVVGNPAPDSVGPLSWRTCAANEYQTCETVHFTFSNPITQAEADAGVKSKTRTVEMRISNYTPVAQYDFDLGLYQSDAAGTKGAYIKQSGNNPGLAEVVNTEITTTLTEPAVHLWLDVVYFAAVNGSFTGTAKFL